MKRDLVFISGGISKNPNFRKDFRRGEKKLRAAGFNVINPVTMITSVELPTHEDYMDISLAWLDKAQAIYALRLVHQRGGKHRVQPRKSKGDPDLL